MNPDAVPVDPDQVLRVLAYAPDQPDFDRLDAALTAAFPLAQTVRATDLGALRRRLAEQRWAAVIAPWSGESAWQAVAAAVQSDGGVPLIAAVDDFNVTAYARALAAGADHVTALDGSECLRVVLGRGLAAGHRARDALDTAGEPVGHDLLTGLHNYQYLVDVFDGITASPPGPGRHHALLYVRIDDYAALSARLGAARCGMLLADVAELLHSGIDSRDIPVRVHSEAFAVLLRDRPREHIEQIARTLLMRVAGHRFMADGKAVTLSASIGIGLVGDAGEPLDDVATKASLACEVAQDEAGGHYHIYDHAADEKLRFARRTDLEQQLYRALDAGGFRAVFQPIANLHAPAGENYEMLLRLAVGGGREMLPAEFMGTAVGVGLMPQIDRWVIRRALSLLHRRETEQKATRFFIKLDAQTVADPALLPWLAQQLRSTRVPGDRLVLQISEAAAARDPDAFRALIAGLRQLHCLCALEHAGRTPQGADLIAALDVDYIKIDGPLAHDLGDDEQHRAAVQGLIETARRSGKRSIVPFVEDAKSLSLLWRWGADYVQGHYLQRPDARLQYAFEGG